MKPNIRLGLLILAIGFPLNLFCEYLHMPLFEVHFLHGYIDSRLVLSICSALLNVAWTFLMYFAMSNVFGKKWMTHWNIQKTLAVIGSGMILVCIGERIALMTGVWSYAAAMPIIPLGIGLTPFLIISTVPLATMYLSSKFA